MLPQFTPSDIERFWSRVEKTDTCWLWTGGLFDDGYGAFRIAGKSFRAHHVSWMLTHGAIPDGLLVCHNCPDGDNPRCVNIAHLWTGTHQENMNDMIAKGRSLTGDRNPSRLHPETKPRGDQHFSRLHSELLARGNANGSRLHPERLIRGEQHPKSAVTEEQVRTIRQRYATGSVFQYELAAEFGISQGAICSIVARKTWKHVE